MQEGDFPLPINDFVPFLEYQISGVFKDTTAPPAWNVLATGRFCTDEIVNKLHEHKAAWTAFQLSGAKTGDEANGWDACDFLYALYNWRSFYAQLNKDERILHCNAYIFASWRYSKLYSSEVPPSRFLDETSQMNSFKQWISQTVLNFRLGRGGFVYDYRVQEDDLSQVSPWIGVVVLFQKIASKDLVVKESMCSSLQTWIKREGSNYSLISKNLLSRKKLEKESRYICYTRAKQSTEDDATRARFLEAAKQGYAMDFSQLVDSTEKRLKDDLGKTLGESVDKLKQGVSTTVNTTILPWAVSGGISYAVTKALPMPSALRWLFGPTLALCNQKLIGFFLQHVMPQTTKT